MEDEKGQTIAINSLTVRCGYTPPPKYSQGHSRNSKNEEASSDRAPNTANNKGFGKGFQKVFGNNMGFSMRNLLLQCVRVSGGVFSLGVFIIAFNFIANVFEILLNTFVVQSSFFSNFVIHL